MQDKSQIPYDLEVLRRQLPHDRAELFIGFVPWTEDAEGWKRSVKEKLTETPERSVTRTVWDSSEKRDERVLIDVVECESATEALDALVDRLLWNQLSRLLEGSKGLGDAVFMHPKGVPPGIFFTRGNLCLSVVSFGKQPMAVTPWAERLNRRLDDRPSVDRMTISLRVETTPMKVGQEVEFRYTLPWQYSEEGYLKFLVRGSTLLRHDDRLTLTGTKPGEVTIDAE